MLDRLLLHQNRLQWVHRLAFHDLHRLTTLYLFNNSLTELSGACLALLPALEYLRLNDNLWECDCKVGHSSNTPQNTPLKHTSNTTHLFQLAFRLNQMFI